MSNPELLPHTWKPLLNGARLKMSYSLGRGEKNPLFSKVPSHVGPSGLI